MTLSGKMILEKEVLFIVQGLPIQTPKKLILLLLEALMQMKLRYFNLMMLQDLKRLARSQDFKEEFSLLILTKLQEDL